MEVDLDWLQKHPATASDWQGLDNLHGLCAGVEDCAGTGYDFGDP